LDKFCRQFAKQLDDGIPRRAARRGIRFFLRLNRREILHFVQNDKEVGGATVV
jgi:hypothetical protein